MPDKLTRTIERTGAVIDLITGVVFLALVVRVYQWANEFLVLVLP